jgi:hypothetical protein
MAGNEAYRRKAGRVRQLSGAPSRRTATALPQKTPRLLRRPRTSARLTRAGSAPRGRCPARCGQPDSLTSDTGRSRACVRPGVSVHRSPGPRTLAEKVRWLIDTAHPADRGPYSISEVCFLIHKAMGEEVSHTTIWKLAYGQSQNPSKRLIELLARTFGVPRRSLRRLRRMAAEGAGQAADPGPGREDHQRPVPRPSRAGRRGAAGQSPTLSRGPRAPKRNGSSANGAKAVIVAETRVSQAHSL